MTPAPLYARPDAPLHGQASWVEAADGGRLRAALFRPKGEPRGSVVVSPGRTEPIEKYAETIADLQARRFTVVIHDWRGQGLSEPFPHASVGPDGVRRGHARGWRLFLSDFARVLDAHAQRLPRPWIALGHSMGGALTLLAMAEGEGRFDGAILSAPMLGLRLGGRPPGLVSAVAAVMGFLGRAGDVTPPAAPKPRRADTREVEALTHDAVRRAGVEALLAAHPELRVGATTWGWVQFALALIGRLKALHGLETIAAPVTIVAAERDRLVANAPQRAAVARLLNGRYVEVAGAFHELLIETDDRRAVFWRAFDEMAAIVAPA